MSDGLIRDWLFTVLDNEGKPTDTQGIATELDLGSLEIAHDTDKRAGAYGVVALPQTPDEMEVSVSTIGMTEELHNALLSGVSGEISLQFNGVEENPEVGTSKGIVIVLRGSIGSIPFGSYTAQSNAEFEFTMMVNYINRLWGTSRFIYDPRNYLWEVNGKNLLAAKKAALGV
ncbi:MAG: phage major tail tube protein [Cyanobacteria bacterium J06643_5]